MHILISEPNKEALEKNGWEQWKKTPVYKKKVGNTTVCVQLPYYELPHECWVINSENVLTSDLTAIASELQKLQEK